MTVWGWFPAVSALIVHSLDALVFISLVFGTLECSWEQLVFTHQLGRIADGIRPEQIAWDVDREPGVIKRTAIPDHDNHVQISRRSVVEWDMKVC